MYSQKELLKNKNWDLLIILDACRYDYFEKLYLDYFEGDLKKVKSLGSSTPEWRSNTFQNEYFDDVIYISSNAFINSKVKVRGFLASNHFNEVIDVWDWGWEEEIGNVPPKKVTKEIKKQKKKEKKIIAHYNQPHTPYLHLSELTPANSSLISASNKQNKGNLFSKIKSQIGPLLEKLIGRKYTWKLKDLLNLEPLNPMEIVFREKGEDGVRKAYEKNLEIVLRHINEKLEEFDGKIIITADHGEMLGEKNFFGHDPARKDKELTMVPWFRVDKFK